MPIQFSSKTTELNFNNIDAHADSGRISLENQKLVVKSGVLAHMKYAVWASFCPNQAHEHNESVKTALKEGAIAHFEDKGTALDKDFLNKHSDHFFSTNMKEVKLSFRGLNDLEGFKEKFGKETGALKEGMAKTYYTRAGAFFYTKEDFDKNEGQVKEELSNAGKIYGQDVERYKNEYDRIHPKLSYGSQQRFQRKMDYAHGRANSEAVDKALHFSSTVHPEYKKQEAAIAKDIFTTMPQAEKPVESASAGGIKKTSVNNKGFKNEANGLVSDFDQWKSSNGSDRKELARLKSNAKTYLKEDDDHKILVEKFPLGQGAATWKNQLLDDATRNNLQEIVDYKLQ